jgi:hypothetical protein
MTADAAVILPTIMFPFVMLTSPSILTEPTITTAPLPPLMCNELADTSPAKSVPVLVVKNPA